jgi:hypothetical protein
VGITDADFGLGKECGGFYGMTIPIHLRIRCEFWVRKGMLCFFGIPIPLMWELRMRILGQERNVVAFME